jgi:prepilin-type processing-associated H-X9-DG protein
MVGSQSQIVDWGISMYYYGLGAQSWTDPCSDRAGFGAPATAEAHAPGSLAVVDPSCAMIYNWISVVLCEGKPIGEHDITAFMSAIGSRDDDGQSLPSTYPRLKEGIERFLITDINNPAAGTTAQSSVMVMWDAWNVNQTVHGAADAGVLRFNHVPGGSNVLYLDGHVEFVKLHQKAPLLVQEGLDPASLAGAFYPGTTSTYSGIYVGNMAGMG